MAVLPTPQDGVKARMPSGILGFAVVVVQASMAWCASGLVYYHTGCDIDDGRKNPGFIKSEVPGFYPFVQIK